MQSISLRQTRTYALTALFLCGIAAAALADDVPTGAFKLSLRHRVPVSEDASRFHIAHRTESWQASQSALIVCDMWDAHHCLNAVKRGTEMAPRMNKVIAEARKRGVIIIHAPSSCMSAYTQHPARKRALSVTRSTQLPPKIQEWCDQIDAETKGEYPIDQSDGGEDDDPEEHLAWAKQLESQGRNPRSPWQAQTPLITIDEQKDYISDDGEVIWSILDAQQRKNVMLVGVHLNMCVLGRPFGLRQMAQNGKNVVLVRDMTDTMYNPAMKPHVSHFTGTDLMVEHVEKWVCPTITSDQMIGGKPFAFKNDRRPHIAIVSAEREYKTEETLPKFALKHLGHDFRVSYVFADANDRNLLPGIRLLEQADLLLLSVRRRLLNKAQMQVLERYVKSGKPIVGLRTANHAFSLRNKPATGDLHDWPNWDQQIIGGSYTNHHGAGPHAKITADDNANDHPILDGVNLANLTGKGSLYLVNPLQPNARPLLHGQIPDHPPQTVAWIHQTEFGNRVFYTSLGHPGDFEQAEFQRLLKNGIHWAVGNKSANIQTKVGNKF